MSISLGNNKRLSLGSVFGIFTTLLGVLSTPSVLAVLPAKAAGVVTLAGVVIAAVSKSLVHSAE